MSAFNEHIYHLSPVWFQNQLVSALGHRLYRRRYTGIYHELRELVRASRDWSAAERTAYQSEHLHEMIKYCRGYIPYYQELFSAHGLHENDFTSLEDLTRLPILRKRTVQERSHEFRAPQEKPFMTQHTSGSTGSPLALQVNERTYKLAMALLVDHEEYHGIPFGARRATFAGRMVQRSDNMNPPFSRFNRAENQRLYSSYHLNESTFAHYQRDLEKFAPNEIIGYPSAISDLATHYLQLGQKPGFRPTAVITNSETLLEWQRERIESVFQCPVFDYYGTAEYVLFAGQDRSGHYQVNPVIGVTEVVPENGDSGIGRIISTSLTNTCMPLLRYEVGDTATVKEPDGQSTIVSSLVSVNGRVDDYIRTPDGRKIGRLDHIFKGNDSIAEAQIVQRSIDHCTIIIVARDDQRPPDTNVLKEQFRARVGNEINVSVELVSFIPKTRNGKFRSVVSLIGA